MMHLLAMELLAEGTSGEAMLCEWVVIGVLEVAGVYVLFKLLTRPRKRPKNPWDQ
jgi:hypothetical protein